jgi:hypothetical protein
MELTVEGQLGEMSFDATARLLVKVGELLASADQAAHAGKRSFRAVVSDIHGGSVVAAIDLLEVEDAGAGEPERVALTVINGVGALTEDDPHIPAGFDVRTVKALGAVSRNLDRSMPRAHLRLIDGSVRAEPVVIERSLAAKASLATRARTTVWGALEGSIDLVSLRGKPKFGLFERLERRPVTCLAPPDVVEVARDALGRRVLVTGMLSLNAQDQVVSISAESIEVLPEDSQLPRVAQFAGRFPDHLGGHDPVEYVRELRGGGDAY